MVSTQTEKILRGISPVFRGKQELVTSLKSSSIHFPKHTVFYWDSSFQTFHHSNPPKSLKDMHHGLWRDSLCNNVLQRRSPKQPLGATISEFVVLCIRWWTNMLGFKNQYDEVMSLRVQEPFRLLWTKTWITTRSRLFDSIEEDVPYHHQEILWKEIQ